MLYGKVCRAAEVHRFLDIRAHERVPTPNDPHGGTPLRNGGGVESGTGGARLKHQKQTRVQLDITDECTREREGGRESGGKREKRERGNEASERESGVPQ